jgi:hypothetical protein
VLPKEGSSNEHAPEIHITDEFELLYDAEKFEGENPLLRHRSLSEPPKFSRRESTRKSITRSRKAQLTPEERKALRDKNPTLGERGRDLDTTETTAEAKTGRTEVLRDSRRLLPRYANVLILAVINLTVRGNRSRTHTRSLSRKISMELDEAEPAEVIDKSNLLQEDTGRTSLAQIAAFATSRMNKQSPSDLSTELTKAEDVFGALTRTKLEEKDSKSAPEDEQTSQLNRSFDVEINAHCVQASPKNRVVAPLNSRRLKYRKRRPLLQMTQRLA